MRSKLLIILLILSLGFNLGVIATFSHHWIMGKGFVKWHGDNSWYYKKMRKMLDLTDEQSKLLEKDREELQKVITPVREELKKKRSELFILLDSEKADNSEIDKLVTDISALQAEIEKNIIEHSIYFRKKLDPEQQKKYKEFMQKSWQRMPREYGFKQDGKPTGR